MPKNLTSSTTGTGLPLRKSCGSGWSFYKNASIPSWWNRT